MAETAVQGATPTESYGNFGLDPAATYPVWVAFQGESPEEYPDAYPGGRKRKPYSLGSVNARLAELGGRG